MMTDLNYLDHCLPFTCKNFDELQLLKNCTQRQKRKIEEDSMNSIAIWTDVEGILENEHDSSAQSCQILCNETAEETSESKTNIDALNVSFKPDDSFELFNWTFNLSNVEKLPTNGTAKSIGIVENYIDNLNSSLLLILFQM